MLANATNIVKTKETLNNKTFCFALTNILNLFTSPLPLIAFIGCNFLIRFAPVYVKTATIKTSIISTQINALISNNKLKEKPACKVNTSDNIGNIP